MLDEEEEQLDDEQLEDEQLDEHELEHELEHEEEEHVVVQAQVELPRLAASTFATLLMTTTRASKSSFLIRLSSPLFKPPYVAVGILRQGAPDAEELFTY